MKLRALLPGSHYKCPTTETQTLPVLTAYKQDTKVVLTISMLNESDIRPAARWQVHMFWH